MCPILHQLLMMQPIWYPNCGDCVGVAVDLDWFTVGRHATQKKYPQALERIQLAFWYVGCFQGYVQNLVLSVYKNNSLRISGHIVQKIKTRSTVFFCWV